MLDVDNLARAKKNLRRPRRICVYKLYSTGGFARNPGTVRHSRISHTRKIKEAMVFAQLIWVNCRHFCKENSQLRHLQWIDGFSYGVWTKIKRRFYSWSWRRQINCQFMTCQ